jgi:hypothetical protein
MTIREMAKALELESLHGEWNDCEIQGGCTSDLLSDVIAHASPGEALITVQAHKNTIAAAVLRGLSAVILANSRPVPGDMIEAARKEGIALFRSGESQFVLSGRLYALTGAVRSFYPGGKGI